MFTSYSTYAPETYIPLGNEFGKASGSSIIPDYDGAFVRVSAALKNIENEAALRAETTGLDQTAKKLNGSTVGNAWESIKLGEENGYDMSALKRRVTHNHAKGRKGKDDTAEDTLHNEPRFVMPVHGLIGPVV